MAVALALLAALTVGAADIGGSIATRRGSPWVTAMWFNGFAILCTLVIVPFFDGAPSLLDMLLGSLAGIGAGGGLLFLYLGYERSELGIVGPTAAVMGAIVPVVVGFLSAGTPAATVQIGMAVGLVAIALIAWSPTERLTTGLEASRSTRRRAGVFFGALAGASYGLMGVSLGLTDEDAGMWPAVATRLFATIFLFVLASALKRPRIPVPGLGPIIVSSAVFATASIVLFTLAARDDLAVAGLLIQLGYAVSIVAAIFLFGERWLRTQVAGFAAAAVAVALISVG